MENRKKGVLMHISSLPGSYGIGDYSNACNFIDYLNNNGIEYWQMLPLGPTSYGDSPYQSFCSNALNPYFISINVLKRDGLLTDEDIQEKETDKINYSDLFYERYDTLFKAFKRYVPDEKFDKYVNDNKHWLEDYSLFMALKKYFKWVSWKDWDEDIKGRSVSAIRKYKSLLYTDIQFFKYVQYTADKQHNLLLCYAGLRDVKVIVDLPIYVPEDSVEVWCNPELFDINLETLELNNVAGCPPDCFSATGQLWGNPLYNWEKMKKTKYSWWVNRIEYQLQKYGHMLRLDHFRAFADYYAIPAGAEDATVGEWKDGPGMDLFKHLDYRTDKLIAEDLGILSDKAVNLLKDTGIAGMNIIQFAFNGDENNPYLTKNHKENSVTYTGTHDNSTSLGWYNSLESKFQINDTIALSNEEYFIPAFLGYTARSKSNIVIFPMQDILGLDDEARMNTPGTINNWTWKLKNNDYLDVELKMF